jgi:hypothetical protein
MTASRGLCVAVMMGVLSLTAAIGGGCSRPADAPPSPQSVFDATVARATVASGAGDAAEAHRLYEEALATEGAVDAGGQVASMARSAEDLIRARSALSAASAGSPLEWAQALQWASAETTEAAAARNGLVDFLGGYSGQLRKEIAVVRKGIRAGRSVDWPATADLIQRRGQAWRDQVAVVPGATGEHAVAGVDRLTEAVRSIDKAWDHGYTQALRDLSAADRSLDAADREFEAVLRVAP